MSLFSSAAAAPAAAATNTTGDISKDVALNQPPEDGISDLRFSPVSDHLAVASWDKKVRIYEINDQGQSEGKALFEHEGPVLNCCWSPVSLVQVPIPQSRRAQQLTSIFQSRMDPRSWELVPTRQPACWISELVEPLLFRLPHTTRPFEAAT